ncbi:MAG: UDP-N-acetylmuramoyl-tripeptide--D-alanyl-D-alanine ligase [Firmicutes bacterium]|nr:UDP-N-acetylmuramoyl-tripeptide--D-alanyl-D-alanine ligase [Bacillota bacterium]
MELIQMNEVLSWTGGTWTGMEKSAGLTGISTDSRTVAPGELFIPLSGENFDGHNYIDTAINKGATGFLSSKPITNGHRDKGGIIVGDTLSAYQEIARGYLKKFRIPVIAVTGSNGKTTTKDLVTRILSEKFKIVKTEKNYNNEVGVPKTVLSIDSSTEALVVELAMRGMGQIRELSRIVEPDIAVITNVGESHIELLGSRDAIASTKGEILEYLNPNGFAILNADDDYYQYMSEKSPAQVISFGIRNKADIMLIKKEDRGLDGYNLIVAIESSIHSFNLPLMGEHNIYNALAGIAVATCLRMSGKEIFNGLESVKPTEKRMEINKTPGGWVVLNDSYNASPQSMGKALEVLRDLPCSGRKIAVLADMLELGDIAPAAHNEIGRKAVECGVNMLFTKGELGSCIAQGAKTAELNGELVHHLADSGAIIEKLRGMVEPGDIILVKGSRRMKMEEIAEALI